MDYTQSIILALLQGLTEFLPISSSAHLILLPQLLGWQDQGQAFDVAVHVGTLLAVVLFVRREIGRIVPAWLGGWRNRQWTQDGQLGWFIALATIPVGLVGLLASGWLELNLRQPMVIAISTAFFAILLWWSDRGATTAQRALPQLKWQHALLTGLAQALALIPGTSRSGITMTAMLALGYRREAAARFSFLLAVPVIALSGLFKTAELIAAPQPVVWGTLLSGVVVAAVVAYCSMHWFVKFVTRVGMLPFVVYRLLLALVILLVLV
ncbi:MAG: undecaprenyl-diphosphate phosphatase [Gammaproteobacteria bacterium]|nr:undecaprenyl-diphosphate phosphatase [Gammaproteobacteria bacterium]